MSIAFLIALLAVILVVSIESFRLYKCPQSLFDAVIRHGVTEWPYRQWNVQESIFSRLFRPAFQTFNVIQHFSLIQVVYQIRLFCVLEFLFERVEHHPAQFLDVVLMPSVAVLPSEAVRQIRCFYGRLGGGLQVQKQLLQLVRYGSGFVDAVEFPVVKGVSKFGRHV